MRQGGAGLGDRIVIGGGGRWHRLGRRPDHRPGLRRARGRVAIRPLRVATSRRAFRATHRRPVVVPARNRQVGPPDRASSMARPAEHRVLPVSSASVVPVHRCPVKSVVVAAVAVSTVVVAEAWGTDIQMAPAVAVRVWADSTQPGTHEGSGSVTITPTTECTPATSTSTTTAPAPVTVANNVATAAKPVAANPSYTG